jgi:tight adherence protein B
MASFVALVAGYGVYLLYTAVVLRWRGIGVAPGMDAHRQAGRSWTTWLAQAGIVGARPAEVVAVMAAVAAAAFVVGWSVFGAAAPAAAIGGVGGLAPVGVYRARRAGLRRAARQAWPRLIEDVRVQTGSLGRSIPNALLDAGRRAPVPSMRTVFEAAHREWLLSTDLERTVTAIKTGLGDATADTTCETLLVAHEVGGTDLDRRLAALADDRAADLESRKDAEARQAGARFARWFVLIVPAGMALVGLSIGDGRAAYRSSTGQLAVLAAVAITAACWAWASAIMRLPDEDRVFAP